MVELVKRRMKIEERSLRVFETAKRSVMSSDSLLELPVGGSGVQNGRYPCRQQILTGIGLT